MKEESLFFDNLFSNCINEINDLFHKDSYLSKKDYQKILDKYKNVFEFIQYLSNNDFRKLQLIKIANEIDHMITNHNLNFVNQKMIQYREYFDNIFKEVDSNILLDQEQRKAILMDEDYSLVIAGAGSGKTTTMTAKVKYLIDKCYVKPEEIVILSFTTKAVAELESRINEDFKLGVNVKTFHKLGLEILNDRLNHPVRAIDEHKKAEFLNNYFKQHIFPNKRKLAHIMKIFNKQLFLEPECLEYKTFDDYWNFYTNKKYQLEKKHLKEYNDFEIEKRLKGNRSINNEFLRSKHETIIANFLYINGIKYAYEQKYDEEENKINYYPDFTIFTPTGKIYIEYYGLTKFHPQGHYSIEEIIAYQNLERKKKLLHQKYGTDLISIYPDEDFTSTQYLSILQQELEKRGIFLNARTNKQIFLRLMETSKDSQIFKFKDLLISFISKFKSKSYSDKDFDFLKQKTEHTIVHQQLDVIRTFYHAYNTYIHNQYLVDFEDMINYAYTYMNNQPLKRSDLKYKYIIVDEYQDISYQRFNLLQKISEVFNAKIVGVGDDWQAIFGFSGADIKLFTNFCELMGYGEIIKITNTYRNSQELINIAGEFVLKNSHQFDKHLNSPKHLSNPIEIIYYDRTIKGSKVELLERILTRIYFANPNHNVLLLGRYKNDIEEILQNPKFKEGIKSNNEIIYAEFNDMKINFLTIHSAKGLGFDQVILINAVDGKYGFPSKVEDEEIISILNNDVETDIEFAEERRLFYVAITRTKNKVFILAPDSKTSSFITEICRYDNVIEELEII